MPRTVPLRALPEMLTWHKFAASPCAAKSFWHHALAKKPRASLRRSRSMMNAPLMAVFWKILGRTCRACGVALRRKRRENSVKNAHLGDRHHEAAAPVADKGDLFHDFRLQ